MMRGLASTKKFVFGVFALIFSTRLLLADQATSGLVVVDSTAQAPVQPEKKLSITLVTLSTPDRIAFSGQTVNSFVNYAWKWGYRFHLCTRSLEPARHAAWSKIRLMIDLLEEGASDWYVWLDDDLLITNPEISIENFISEYGSRADLILSEERIAGPGGRINTGLFLIRRSSWAQYFLQRVWDIGYSRFAHQHAFDQAAVEELLSVDEFKNNSKIIKAPVRRIQSLLMLVDKDDKIDYGLWQPGDFAAHVCGATTEMRTFIFEQLIQNPLVYPQVPDVFQPWWVFKQEHLRTPQDSKYSAVTLG